MNIEKIKVWVKEYLKLFYVYPDFFRCISDIRMPKEKRVFLIGTPAHGNLGDHAIALSEIGFLKEYYSDCHVTEVIMPFYKTHRSFLKKHVRKEDLIVVSGGGWMGNLWIHNEITIREIVNDYPNNKIIIFPQTVFYTEDEEGMRVAEETKKIFQQHSNLLLTVRDDNSMRCAKDLLGMKKDINVIFCPDMVLYGSLAKDIISLNRDETQSPTALLCLRQDVEKIIDLDNACQILSSLGYNILQTTTVLPYPVKKSHRKKELKKKIDEFSEASLVVTDRLHAMLFSVLVGCPCCVFDNRTGKVFGVAKYLKENNIQIKMLGHISELKNCIELKNERCKYTMPESIKGYFDHLADFF